VISITGVGIIFPGLVRPVVGLVSQPTPDPSPRIEMPSAAGTPLLSPDAIVRIVQAAKPDMAIAMLNPPTETRNMWRVQFRAEGADPAVRARGAIWLDPWSGVVVHDRTSGATSMGDRYLAEQLWIHNGATFGLIGRLFVFVAGFAPLTLLVSGAIMWFRKRPGRMRAG
jgi:uncharacterized iron-regulated membrane protein